MLPRKIKYGVVEMIRVAKIVLGVFPRLETSFLESQQSQNMKAPSSQKVPVQVGILQAKLTLL